MDGFPPASSHTAGCGAVNYFFPGISCACSLTCNNVTYIHSGLETMEQLYVKLCIYIFFI